MKGSEKKFRTGFEEAWQEALEGAEMAPETGAWQRMEAKLAEMEAAKYRQYYLFYRAAAAVILLFAVASLLYFGIPTFQGEKLAGESTQKENNPIASADNLPKSKSNTSELPSLDVREGEAVSPSDLLDEEKSKAKNSGNEKTAPSLASALPDGSTLETPEKAANQAGEMETPPLKEQLETSSPVLAQSSANEKKTLSPDSGKLTPAKKEGVKTLPGDLLPSSQSLAVETVSSGKEILALKAYGTKPLPFQWLLPGIKLPEQLQIQSEKEQQKEENSPQLYANVNVNSDFFNPNFGRNESAMASSVSNFRSFNAESSNSDGLQDLPRASQEVGQENTPQASFTYGINMGMKLSEHWLVESGVNYANYNTNTRTTAVVSDFSVNEITPLTVQNAISAANSDQFPQTFNSEFGLNNSFEFASIPVTAGYVFGIKKFNLILKAGVATDFFLRNEISDENDMLKTVTMTPGAGSPFRSVMLNGTVGNEINYMLNKHYSFSLTANYRFALQSFTKPDESFSSLPNAYGIGMAFRYHFNN